MKIYTEKDCLKVGTLEEWKGKILVVKPEAVPKDTNGQLFLCMMEQEDYMQNRTQVPLIALSDHSYHLAEEKNIVGILKPEALSDEERLQLAQIPTGKKPDFNRNNPEFSGYCYLRNGRYNVGVWLRDADAVQQYIEVQKPYQHKIQICDRDDFTVLKIVEGELIYPMKQMIESGKMDPIISM